MPPLVAVVIPAYNAERFLGDAVSSVLAQTFPDFRVLVVDDGSAVEVSRTLDIADSRVTVLRRTHGGPSAARNDGWRSAPTCRYVAFLDADDMWDPDKLERQVAAMEVCRDCVALGSLMRYVSSAGTVLGTAGQVLRPGDERRIAAGELQPFQLSSILVRRDALREVGGFDDELGRVGSEDLDLLARLACIGRIDMVPSVLGSYRIHASSSMARYRTRINRGARFVRMRQMARREGQDLTWSAFAATERTSWTDRRRDAVERCYRRAGLWYAERQTLRALGFALLAVAIDPRYTLLRAYRQTTRSARAGITRGER